MIQVTRTQFTDITPQYPTYIGGHAMRTGKFTGVHDPIEVTFLGLRVDGEPFLFAEADISNFDNDFAKLYKYYMHEYLQIPYNNIILSAGHSHSAPLFKTRNPDMPADEKWRKYVFEKITAKGKEVMNGPFYDVSKVKFTTGQSEGFYGNRNSSSLYGDTNIYIVDFLDANNSIISSLVNMSCHSTVLSPLEYELSGDLLAAIRRKLSLIKGVTPLVCNGNAGDVSNRLYRKANDFNELDRVSEGIVNQINGFSNTFEINLHSPETRMFNFHVEYDPDIKKLQERLDESKKKLEITDKFDDRKWLISEINGFERKIEQGHVDLNLETTIICMGDLEIVVVPCELVSAFGRQIKKSSQAKACFIWGYANGQNGYVVEASGFGGGHDGISTQMPKGKAEEYVSVIIQNLFDD